MTTFSWIHFPSTPIEQSRTSTIRCAIWKENLILFENKDGKNSMFKLNLEKISPTQCEWEKVQQRGEAPNSSNDFSCVVFKDNLCIFGGLTDQNVVVNDFFIFNFRTNTWKKMNTEGLVPRRSHAAAIYKNKMILFGGTNEIGQKIGFQQLDVYDFNKWSKWTTTGDIPPARSEAMITIYKDSLYMFGGTSCSIFDELNDFYELNLVTKQWRQIKCHEPHRRVSGSLIAHNDSLYMFGGYSGSNEIYGGDVYYIDKLERFDLTKKQWNEVEVVGERPIARAHHEALVYKGHMIVIGGIHESKDVSREMMALKLPKYDAYWNGGKQVMKTYVDVVRVSNCEEKFTSVVAWVN